MDPEPILSDMDGWHMTGSKPFEINHLRFFVSKAELRGWMDDVVNSLLTSKTKEALIVSWSTTSHHHPSLFLIEGSGLHRIRLRWALSWPCHDLAGSVLSTIPRINPESWER